MADVRAQSSNAPVEEANASPGTGDDDAMPSVARTRRNLIIFVSFVITAIVFLYFGLPKIAGLDETWNRVGDGNPWWLTAAFFLEAGSMFSYVMLLRFVCGRESGMGRIDWRASYEITMAGLAATRLFAAGGAGGIALTAWALRSAGFERRKVADQMIAFLALQYAVYMSALVIGGVGLYVGLFPGSAPFAITIVPAIFGFVVILIVLAITLIPQGFERRVAREASRSGRAAKWARRLATGPASMASGARLAIRLASTRDVRLLGAVGWWGFDISVLWCTFHAFGHAPPLAVLIVGYFVGVLGNLLPLPGGVGGVDGGMIGAFVAFGEPTGLTVVAVLVYRGFAFWLPTLPGAIAYLTLRRTVGRWKVERAEEAGPEPGAASVTAAA
jgi:uncharacterized protein (TIRG00374 family)